MLRAAACALVSTQLSGCFFFFVVPTDQVHDLVTGHHGNACVAASAVLGSTVHLDGRVGTVAALDGLDGRCPDSLPIRATVTL